MKVSFKLIGISLLAVGILAACGNDEGSDDHDPDMDEDSSEPVNHSPDDEDINESEENESSFSDQVELTIGETGQVSSNLGQFEVTITDVTMESEVDGQNSQLDFFILAEVTVKNIGDAAISSEDIISILELTHDLELAGTGGDFSANYESVETITGELASGEEVSGQMLFNAYESDNQHIRVIEGLISADSVKNRVTWTIPKGDLE